MARPGEIRALALTDDSGVPKGNEVLLWRGRGAINGRGGLDLKGRFASRLGYASDLDGGTAIAHARGGRF